MTEVMTIDHIKVDEDLHHHDEDVNITIETDLKIPIDEVEAEVENTIGPRVEEDLVKRLSWKVLHHT